MFHAASSYAGASAGPSVQGGAPTDAPIALPDPRSLSQPLERALAERASCRQFSGDALELDTVAALLSACYGAQEEEVTVEGSAFRPRPVPSAGASYPLEVDLLVRAVPGLDAGSYRYLSESHAVRRTGSGLSFAFLAEIFLDQPYLEAAAVVVVLSAALDRTTMRYGDRGYRYVLFEAGHAAQNLVLAAAALKTGSLNLGGFLDAALATALQLRSGVVPLYGVALGPPAALAPDELRQP
jgi:SagB-type dehydrogenase family enzyme